MEKTCSMKPDDIMEVQLSTDIINLLDWKQGIIPVVDCELIETLGKPDAASIISLARQLTLKMERRKHHPQY